MFPLTILFMLTVLLDVGVGNLAAKQTRSIGLIVLAAIGGGWISCLLGNAAVSALLPNMTTPEIFGRILMGLIYHPIIAFIAALVFRRRYAG